MSCKVTEQNNEEIKRNDEENNDVETEEDYKEEKNVIVFHITKNASNEWSDAKKCG